MRWNVLKDAAAVRIFAVALIGVLASATEARVEPLTETEILTSLAGKTIQPGLQRAASASETLATATRTLCSRKDEQSLHKAREAWFEAYLAWRSVQPVLLDEKASKARQLVDNWPVNEVVLNGGISAKDLAHLLENPDVRGFSAVEYLLFAPAGIGEATSEGRCSHLQNVVDEIAGQAGSNQRRWQEESAAFVAAGDGNPYLVPGDALSLVFAQMLNVTERMLRDRLCAPSGFFEGASKPELLEAWRSDRSRTSFQASIAGLRRALVGDGTGGITALVASRDGLITKKNPELAAKIGKQLDTVDKQLAELDEGIVLHKKLEKDDQLLRPLYKSIEKLQEMIVEASLNLEVDIRGPGATQM